MTTTAAPTGADDVTWDLGDLYAGPDDPRVSADLEEARQAAVAFRERYHGRIGELDAPGLAAAVAEKERIESLMTRLGAFAMLRFSTDAADPERGAFLQRVREAATSLHSELLFADLEWVAVPDDRAQELLDDDALATYRYHLAAARRYRPHVLSEPEERIANELGLVGAGAWTRLFNELSSAMRIEVDGESLPTEAAMAKLQSPDGELRRRVADGLTTALSATLPTRTFIFNTILLDKATKDRLRGYPHWLSSRNLSNQASDASVDALVEAVTSRYDIPHRYYALKAKLLGVDRLRDFDRFAPLSTDAVTVPWEEARATVLGAYEDFSPVAGRAISEFFERGWIDAAPSENKRPGAFCATTVPDVHPYVFMSFTGDRRSVLTLAHELGHGLHGYLATDRHSLYNASVPLTLAETASVFGEALTFRRILGAEDDPKRRLDLITGQLDDAIATVFRQIAMNRFEDRMHTARREGGELATEDLNGFWEETQSAVLGPAVEITPGYRTWWSYIPHFLHTPGYVYAYAFGYLFSYAIFRRYLERGDDMIDPYLELLASGGSAHPEELAKLVGIDITDPGFWAQGLAGIDEMLGEAERLAGSVSPTS